MMKSPGMQKTPVTISIHELQEKLLAVTSQKPNCPTTHFYPEKSKFVVIATIEMQKIDAPTIAKLADVLKPWDAQLVIRGSGHEHGSAFGGHVEYSLILEIEIMVDAVTA